MKYFRLHSPTALFPLAAACGGLLLLFASAPASGATVTQRASVNVCVNAKPAVDSVVEPRLAHADDAPPHKAVGAEVGLYLDGQACYFSYGTTQFGSGQDPTRYTLFKIGSVTKTFTATMLALHEVRVRNSGFDVNATVDTTLIPCAEDGQCLNLTNGMQALTYFELATFTGGLPRDPTNLHPNYTQADYITFLNGLSAPPGGLPANNLYSNASYGFLGELVMALDGYHDFNDPEAYRTSFDQWIGANITEPLGMTCTAADISALPSSCDVDSKVATGYAYQNGHYVAFPKKMPPWMPNGPAGRVYSTAQDMVRYLAAYLGAGEIYGLPVPADLTQAMALARAPTAVTTIEPANRQAYSWVVTDMADPKNSITFKNGGLLGFFSCVTMMPSHQTGVVLLTTGDHPPTCQMAETILQKTKAQGGGGGSGGFAPFGLCLLFFAGIIFCLQRHKLVTRRPNGT